MKRTQTLTFAFGGAIALCFVGRLISAQGESEDSLARKLEGTWRVQVTLRNLTLIEPVIVDLDWALLKLKSYFAQTYHVRDGDTGGASAVLQLEESLYPRSEALVEMLSCFIEMNLKGKACIYCICSFNSKVSNSVSIPLRLAS